MRILIFALGLKGFKVLEALSLFGGIESLFCVIGQDENVKNDYSVHIQRFCYDNKIAFQYREGFEIDTNAFDYFLAVGWRWMLKDIPEKKLIIFHDSLLPKYRGFAPLVSALLNRDSVTGVTALFGAMRFDEGPIIIQKEMKLSYPTTIACEIERIATVYSEVAHDLILRLTVEDIYANCIPQDAKLVSYSLWRDNEDYRIDWSNSSIDIGHFVSCVDWPYRGASALFDGALVRVHKVYPIDDLVIMNRTPGKVIFFENGMPIVVCGSGLLALADVRSESGESILPLKSLRSRFK